MRIDFAKSSAGLLVPNRRNIFLGGVYRVQHVHRGEIIDEFEFDNILVNQGLDYVLGAALTGVTPISTWYVAPFEGNYTPVATDTAASIVASATETTAYTAATRVIWTGIEGTQQATNTVSPATFTFNATKTIYGAMLMSSIAKNSVSGILLSAAQFAAPKTVTNTDQLLFTYTVVASSI